MRTNIELIQIPDMLVVLTLIKNKAYRSTSAIQYETRMTYAHIVKMRNVMVKKGWVVVEKRGRNTINSVTEKGREVAEAFETLIEKMEAELYSKDDKPKVEDKVVDEVDIIKQDDNWY